MPRRRAFPLVTALAVLALTAPALYGHNVPVEDTVEIAVRPVGDRLEVSVHMPISALADANLPRGADRRLMRPEAEQVLLVVARDLGSRLGFQSGDVVLPPPSASARIAPDEASVDFDFVYAAAAGTHGLSARLQAFQAGLRRLAAIAHYRDPSGTTRTFLVTGDAQRVLFEPGIGSVLWGFATRAVRLALDGGDYLLFLLCLALPSRSTRIPRTAAIAFLVSGAAAAVTAGLAPLPPASSPIPSIIQALAASAIVVAALQRIVASESSALTLTATAFGLFNGFVLGEAFRSTVQFAGDHAAFGLGAFVLASLLAQVWALTLLSAGLSTVAARGLPARWIALGLGAYVTHNALHRVMARADFSQNDSWILGQFGVVLVAGWIVAIVLVAVVNTARSGPARTPGAPFAGDLR